jgi:hypothetical protein
MPTLLIVIDRDDDPIDSAVAAAFQTAVQADAMPVGAAMPVDRSATPAGTAPVETAPVMTVRVVTVAQAGNALAMEPADAWVVPFSLNSINLTEQNAATVADDLRAQQAIHAACKDVARLRQQVTQWHSQTGDGALCLPVVLTAKGPLYCEAIGDNHIQPLHLPDRLRQPLYALAGRLLRSLSAPPGVYLVQFAVDGENVVFDRLIPFPDGRALASLGTQTPDLFTCHWRCLTRQAIEDVQILPQAVV